MEVRPNTEEWQRIVEWAQTVDNWEMKPLTETISYRRFRDDSVVFKFVLQPYGLDHPIDVAFFVRQDGRVVFYQKDFIEAYENPKLLSKLIGGFIEVFKVNGKHLSFGFDLDVDYDDFEYTFCVRLSFEMWFKEVVVHTYIRIGFNLDEEDIEFLGRRLWELIQHAPAVDDGSDTKETRTSK